MSTTTPDELNTGEVSVSKQDTLPVESNAAIIEESLTTNTSFPSGDNLEWESLVQAKDEAVVALLTQQELLRSLILQAGDAIISDPEIHELVEGLAKSYDDAALEIRKTMDKHYTDNIPTSGKVSDDDYLTYIQIGAEYIVHAETIASLAGTGYLDIFTRIKTMYPAETANTDMDQSLQTLSEVMSTGTEDIKNATEGLKTDGTK